MIIAQLKMNMKKFEELKICSDILNEMLSNYDNVERVVSTFSREDFYRKHIGMSPALSFSHR